MNVKCLVLIAWAACALLCRARLEAADLVVNKGTAASSEAGITFQITNTNAAEIVRLRGVFLMATSGGEPQAFDWFYATGNSGFLDGMFGMDIAGGPAWTRLGSTTPAYVENSNDAGNPQTLLNFGQILDIPPGQTVTLAIVQRQTSAKVVKYTNGVHVFEPVDGIVVTPYRGLGNAIGKPEVTDLTDPAFNLRQFGSGSQSAGGFRGFIGSINYILVPKSATP